MTFISDCQFSFEKKTMRISFARVLFAASFAACMFLYALLCLICLLYPELLNSFLPNEVKRLILIPICFSSVIIGWQAFQCVWYYVCAFRQKGHIVHYSILICSDSQDALDRVMKHASQLMNPIDGGRKLGIFLLRHAGISVNERRCEMFDVHPISKFSVSKMQSASTNKPGCAFSIKVYEAQ